jgi:hypothetical protein
MKCVIILLLMSGILRPGWLRNQQYDKSHIANGIALSWIMTCCVLLVMSPASNQNVALGQNNRATTNNFDMQLGARTRDWEDKTVATKCSKCGKARKTVPVEGKTMTAAATRDAGKTPLTVENVQEAVVKALATQAPAAAAFAGMHEYERANGFGLGDHTAFGAIAEGVTADEASPGDVGTGEIIDTRQRRGPNMAATILNCIPLMSVTMGLISIIMMGVAQWGASVTDMGSEMVSILRGAAGGFLIMAGACTCAAKMLVFFFVVGLPPTAAYSVAGIGNCARAPAIYSARHLVARAKLDPAVWAPVESSFGGKYNGSQSAKWAWSEVRGYSSDVKQQIAGRTPLDTTSFK